MFEAVGACSATSMHSSTSSSGTGRVKSSRLRTERVVVSSRSAWSRSIMSAVEQRSGTLASGPEPTGRSRAQHIHGAVQAAATAVPMPDEPDEPDEPGEPDEPDEPELVA